MSIYFPRASLIGLMEYRTLFWSLFCYRYVRLMVNCIAVLLYKPIPLPEYPSFTSRDVTVIVPTLEGHGEQFMETLKTICTAKPHEIISTVDENRKKAEETANCIREFAIDEVDIERTAIIILADDDDDVQWPPNPFPSFLAPFQDLKMGRVATRQCLLRTDNLGIFKRVFEFLGAHYLEQRNFDCTATMFMDGGVPCLSGRTLILRTMMVKDTAFRRYFLNEEWFWMPLSADDDTSVTRWIINHGWNMYFQNLPGEEVKTTLESDLKFLEQCIRWSRSNWRSNLRSLLEQATWRRYPWSTYAASLSTPTQLTIVTEPLLIWLCHKMTEVDAMLHLRSIMQLLGFIASTKFIKLVGWLLSATSLGPYPVVCVYLLWLLPWFDQDILPIYSQQHGPIESADIKKRSAI
ncbi:hypothetical protein ACJ73_00691 [Blastomyces percursus]|uniref:Glycosyltransferase 2-like domain-containing protein n=1 Tax=Blastomyces percursus TaxID=1658174 RepID=A0A1J9QIH3_9EURO|nr:hypothetical protein ACJ73_00691 [Blastomyces percursus]